MDKHWEVLLTGKKEEEVVKQREGLEEEEEEVEELSWRPVKKFQVGRSGAVKAEWAHPTNSWLQRMRRPWPNK